jgi:translation elongation factor EF-4
VLLFSGASGSPSGAGTTSTIFSSISSIPMLDLALVKTTSSYPEAPLKALIFDSEYDPYRGVISSIRIVDGVVKAGDKIRMMATGKEFASTFLILAII